MTEIMKPLDQLKHRAFEPKLSNLIQGSEYWAAVKGSDTVHITRGGESLCGLVFPRNKRKRGKSDRSGGRRPKNRPRWYRWLGIEDLPQERHLCDSCLNSRFGRDTDGELRIQIVQDVRDLAGLPHRESSSLSKDELKHLRALLNGDLDA